MNVRYEKRLETTRGFLKNSEGCGFFRFEEGEFRLSADWACRYYFKGDDALCVFMQQAHGLRSAG
jgi:hypothetical protein